MNRNTLLGFKFDLFNNANTNINVYYILLAVYTSSLIKKGGSNKLR